MNTTSTRNQDLVKLLKSVDFKKYDSTKMPLLSQRFKELINNETVVNLLLLSRENDPVKQSKSEIITNILDLFDTYYEKMDKDNPIPSQLCKNICYSILNEFCKDKDNSNYPKNMFKNNFVKYLKEEKLFFKNLKLSPSVSFNVFQSLLNNKDTIEYFDYQFDLDYYDNYVSVAEYLLKTLNTQIYTYINPSPQIINRILNFLKLSEYFIVGCDYDVIDPEELISNTNKLYMLLYSCVSEVISINNHTLEIYKDSLGLYSLQNSPFFVSINKQVKQFKSYIKELVNLDFYKCSIIEELQNIELDERYSDFETIESQIRTLAHCLNKESFLGDNYENFRDNTKYQIPKILNNDVVNIHNKTKLILELDEDLLLDSEKELIDLFIDIEKYNSESGYNEKHKLRTKVIKVLNLSRQTKLTELNQDRLNEFITIYVSHSIFLVSQIKDIKAKIERSNNSSSTNALQMIIYLKYLNDTTQFLNKLTLVNNIDKNRHFLYKQIELYFSLLKYSLSSRLFSEVPLFQQSSVSKKILSPNGSIKLQEIYCRLFQNLETLSKNDTFIDECVINSALFNINDYEQTVKYFGEFVYIDDSKISDLIITLIEKVEEKTKEKVSNETYDTDIPREFLDPIMFTPITEPYEIPDVKQIVDKYTIFNHLTFSHTNPFTNSALTKDEFIEYNQRDDVKERVQKFITDFSKWKTEHKI